MGKETLKPRPPVLSVLCVTQHWTSSGPIVQVGTPVALSPLSGGDVTRVGAQARGGRSLSPVDTRLFHPLHAATWRQRDLRPMQIAPVDKGAPEGLEGKSRPDTERLASSQISYQIHT